MDHNVYAPPQEQGPGAPPPMAPQHPGAEPKNLNIVLVLLLVLSILGLAGALIGVVSGLTGLGQSPPPTQPGMPEGFVEAQAKMYEELKEASMQGPATLVVLIGGAIEGYLLYFVLKARQYQEPARAMLVKTALPIVMAFTIFKWAWGVFITVRTYGVMTNFMERITESMPGAGADQASNIMGTAMVVGVIGGALFSLVWSGGMLFIYGWARRVLGRPDVQSFFALRSAH